MSILEAIPGGSHVLAIYSDREQLIRDCLSCLRTGIKNNEAVILIGDVLSKDQLRHRIREECFLDIDALESTDDLTISTAKEWYFPDGKFDGERIREKWEKASNTARAKGKRGVRAFGSVEGLIENGFANQLVEYESTLASKFNTEFTGICAYLIDHVAKMNGRQLSSLFQSHGIHREFGYNALENPSVNQHMAVLYDSEIQRERAMAIFINEGLKKGEKCVCASVRFRDESFRIRFASIISNYEVNIANGNLKLVDFAPYYVAAMSDNYTAFEELSEKLQREVGSSRENNQVRLVEDCTGFLFENQHFDECVKLEQCWHQYTKINGPVLCLYPRKKLEKYPFDIHKMRILTKHDVVLDTDGNILATYVDEKQSQIERKGVVIDK